VVCGVLPPCSDKCLVERGDAFNEMDHDGVNQLPGRLDRHIQGLPTRDGIIGLLRNMGDLGVPTG
jgi:hypothetical protein